MITHKYIFGLLVLLGTLFCTGVDGVTEIPMSGSEASQDSTQDTDGDGMPDWYELQYQGHVMFEDHFEDGTLSSAWKMKRTYWEETDGKLKSVPQALPGFNYGHSGNGRGAVIALQEGAENWTDYSYEFLCAGSGVVPEFNRHYLPIGFIGWLGTQFRVEEFPESWNEPARTCYNFTMTVADQDVIGDWSLSATDGHYIPGTGWSSSYVGSGYKLASGNSASINSGNQVNHVRILVKENRVFAWVNGEFVGLGEDLSNCASYGGISFSATWEAMCWVDDVVVRFVGLSPNWPDAHLDYDNDGLTNLQEYQNGTDPIQYTSVPSRIPRIEGILDFGQVYIGSTSNRTVEIWNDGNTELSVSNVLANQEFTVLPLDFTIPSGGSETLTVSYSPTAASVTKGYLNLACNATDGITEIPVSGTGVAAASPNATRVIQGLTAIIHVTVPEGAAILGVEDQLSSGIVAYNINDGGIWDPITQKVKWIFSQPGQVRDRALQYSVTATGAALGGSINFGDLNGSIQGDVVFSGGTNPGLLHPADDNGDWSLNLQEVGGSVSRWKSGLDSTRMPIVTRGITLYLQGEKYRYDETVGAEAKRWISLANLSPKDAGTLSSITAMSEPAITSSTAVRFVNYTNVLIAVSPDQDTSAWGLAETIPASATVASISHAGIWDATNHQVKWIFYDGMNRDLSYSLSAPPGDSLAIEGSYSFDGSDEVVIGEMAAVIPRPFNTWLEQHQISGESELLFNEHNQSGIPYGLAYAFGENHASNVPLLTVQFINGIPYAETAQQDPSSVPYIDISIQGTDDLTAELWKMNAIPMQDQQGVPSGKQRWELPATPDQAFYRIRGTQK